MSDDGMQIHWDVPIGRDDRAVPRPGAFRPPGEGRYPVLLLPVIPGLRA